MCVVTCIVKREPCIRQGCLPPNRLGVDQHDGDRRARKRVRLEFEVRIEPRNFLPWNWMSALSETDEVEPTHAEQINVVTARVCNVLTRECHVVQQASPCVQC